MRVDYLCDKLCLWLLIDCISWFRLKDFSGSYIILSFFSGAYAYELDYSANLH